MNTLDVKFNVSLNLRHTIMGIVINVHLITKLSAIPCLLYMCAHSHSTISVAVKLCASCNGYNDICWEEGLMCHMACQVEVHSNRSCNSQGTYKREPRSAKLIRTDLVNLRVYEEVKQK
jgi:hypothetical protein